MLRVILGVIAGFIAWSILWVGSDQVMMSAIGWYGEHQRAFEKAMTNGDAFTADTTILAMHIIRSVVISIMSGFLAAIIANENRRSTLILGIILFLFGAGVEAVAWKYLPIWYHLVFLVLLIPMTILGGKLRKSA
ncbi:MAG: hypothetical protein KA746_10415 [Pyrinomonadaceae bacterium]|nr:hypothetical protein [Pyrinomonadaceae bacterium]MBP6214448.1 hypothetical protein [Pyrinomonadaceae bacterium]